MSNSNDLNIQIHANTKEALANIKKLEAEIKGFATTTKTSSNSIEGFTSSLKTMAGVYVGFEALKGSITSVLDVGMEFEKSIDKLGAISNASANELEAMKQKSEELGATTQYSASQVAEAMNYQAMAGMKSNEILTATKDILDLATVGSMDLARASDIATDSMSGFGLEADDLGRVVDIMAVTTTNANTDVEQLGEAFKNVAPVAKNLNVSMEETSSMLGILANAGRKGGEAGTHLKIIMQRLASSNKSVVNGFKELGIEAYDSNGKLKPMTATLKEIEGKLKDLNEKDRNKILKDLFGEEAISSANIILDNLGSMDELLKKVGNSAGKASKMAKDMNNNLSGDAQKLESALKGLENTIYERFLPALRDMTQSLTEIISYVDENSEEFIKWGKTIVEVVASVYLLRKALLGLALAETALGATSVATAFVGLASKIKIATLALVKFTKTNVILLALGVVIAGVTYKLNEMEAEINKLNDATKKLLQSNTASKELNDELATHYDRTTRQLTLTAKEQIKYKKSVDETLKSKKEFLKTLNPKEQASDYASTLQSIKTLGLWKKKIESATIVKKSLTDATDDATTATNKLSLSEKEHTKELEKTKQKEKDVLNKAYTSRVKQHESMIFSLENKEINLKNSIIKINQDLQNKLADIEQKRLYNRESIDAQIDSIIASSGSKYDEYTNKKLQAETNLSKAKKALLNGDANEYKHYADIYKNIIGGIAGTEIIEKNKVRKFDFKTHKWKLKTIETTKLAKSESNRFAVNSLENLKSLEDKYFSLKKSEEIKLHNQKIEQLQAQLQATKAQLEMEVQRLIIEKQIVEATTGKSFDIDVTGALQSISNLDNQIETLDKQLRKAKPVEVDSKDAVKNIDKLRISYGELELNDVVLTVTSDTSPADFGISKLISKRDGDKVTLEINPEYREAEKEINEAIEYFEGEEIVTVVTANTQKADTKVSTLTKSVKKEKIASVTANTQKAIDKVNALRKKIEKPTVATHTVKINASKALSVISQLKKNTSSTHTVYVKEVHKRATGGMIPLKLATGGEANFERKSGRIAGYDPTDSDDVPALLTRGEFVIKRDAVKHYGDDFLYRLNSQQLPKYATGGLVDIGKPEKLIEELSSKTNSQDNKIEKKEIEKSSFLNELNDLLSNELPSKLKEAIEKLIEQISSAKTQNAVNGLSSGIGRLRSRVDAHLKNRSKIDDISDGLENYKVDDTLDNSDLRSNRVEFEKLRSEEIIKYFPNEMKEINGKNSQATMIENDFYFTKKTSDATLQKEIDLIASLADSELSESTLSSFHQASNKNIQKLKMYVKRSNDDEDIFNESTNSASDKLEILSYKIEKKLHTIEQMRENIESKLSASNIEMPIAITESYDYDRLEKFFNEIKTLKEPPSYFTGDRNYTAKQKRESYMIEHGGRIETLKEQILREIPRFQTGGKLDGYGGGDRNLALLEDGEFIVRKEAVSHYGDDLMSKLNSIQLPKFQSGGAVGKVPSGVDSSQQTNINFTMPNGNSYEMQSSINVADALAQEFRRLA